MQKIQLSIHEPCHENWQQMTPTDQGRFCNACAKEVVDFSMMTDTEVLNYFTKITHEKVCGRAMPSQLGRSISRPKDPKKRLFWYWNYIVMFFMFFAKGNGAKAQGDIKPTTVLNPSKKNITLGQMSTVSLQKPESSRVITGKIKDVDGNPVSFATVKIKGANTGVSADANGAYSIKVHPGDVLAISAVSFKLTEVPVSDNSVLNTVLEKTGNLLTGDVVVMLGGISFRDLDNYDLPINQKYTASIKVKDDNTTLPIGNAKIVIVNNYLANADTTFTDKKGTYKLKGIERYENYHIRIEAAGYEPNEFTINGDDFKDRKKVWEVLLRKQKTKNKSSTTQVKPVSEKVIQLGGINVENVNRDPLYVVDGIIKSNIGDIKPDSIENVEILKGPAGAALFGAAGSNGVILITTHKQKEKNLDTVIVRSDFGTIRSCHNTGRMEVKGLKTERNSEIINLNVESVNNIKIYPNPVQRGGAFNVSVKLKQTGLYNIQVIDAAGRVVLQKQINANTKEFTEKILSDNRWGSGTYYISIADNKNKLINKGSFVFQ